MYWGHRRLMLPWLFLQGFLASILAALVRFIYMFFSFYTFYSKMGGSEGFQNHFRIYSESFQNHFRNISESIQNHFRIVSKLFDKATTKQKRPNIPSNTTTNSAPKTQKPVEITNTRSGRTSKPAPRMNL